MLLRKRCSGAALQAHGGLSALQVQPMSRGRRSHDQNHDQRQRDRAQCIFERLGHDCLFHIASFLQHDMKCAQPVALRRLWAVNAQDTAIYLMWLEHSCRYTSQLVDASGMRVCDKAALVILNALLQSHASHDPQRHCNRLPPGAMNWKHVLYAYGSRVHFGWAQCGRGVPPHPAYSDSFRPQRWLCESVPCGEPEAREALVR